MVAANANYIGEYDHQFEDGPDPEASPDLRFNGSPSYSGLWDSTFTLAVLNITDAEPPFDDSAPIGFNRSVSSGLGRFFRISWTRQW